MAKMIEWVEPYGPNSEPVYMRVTEATAIACMRELAKSKDRGYENDQRALEDFIICHWAEVIEVP